jgi:pimeloyl-ACP methyl ester carboxylesterase
MRMPLFQSPAACGFDAVSTSHDDMFTNPAQQLQPGRGSPLQFFLEPVARVLHYLETTYPALAVFPHMVGLSGGGWTTTVYAALDPQIILSFPVAGSLPFDVRGSSDYHAEEQWPDFYALAGYKDLYILGSYGAALASPGAFGSPPLWRRQTQILNQHDDCCFTPEPAAAQRYVCDVQTVLSMLALDTGQAGAFVFEYDAAASTHQISLDALAQVIVPTLQAGAGGPLAGSCPTDRRPGGTCTERYGGHNGFQLCFATSTECGFEAVKNSVQSCDDVCRAGGGQCLRVYGNDSGNPCVALSEPSCAQTERYDDICVCSL